MTPMRQVFKSLVWIYWLGFAGSSWLYAQMPSAVVYPIKFLALPDQKLQISLNNHVKTQLGYYFTLKSEAELKKATLDVQNELESSQCTEDQCIKKIGENLQAEYSFQVGITRIEPDWDISIQKVDLMEDTTASANELCSACTLEKARSLLRGMILSLRTGTLQIGKASLSMTSDPVAKVFLNGIDQGTTPREISLNTDRESDIFLVVDGYENFTKSYALKPGEKVKEHVKLARKRGELKLNSNPESASIWLNGEEQKDASGQPLKTPSTLRLVYGPHTLQLKMPLYQDYSLSLDVQNHELPPQNITLRPLPGKLVIRVPYQRNGADLYLDEVHVGSMEGETSRILEVESNVSHTLRLEDGKTYSARIPNIQVEPTRSKLIEIQFVRKEVTAPSEFSLSQAEQMLHLGLWGGALLAQWNAQTRAETYNRIGKRNDELAKEYNLAQTDEERQQLKSRYTQNQNAMNSYRVQIENLNGLTVGLLGIDGWLWFSLHFNNKVVQTPDFFGGLQVAIVPNLQSPTQISLRWHF
ncbi:MAG: PEGA domain-containing protein [SAR324 cluster bacterium]|nr:PEGA domain-containing protein [SAR324 cluster bacterium]